MPGPLKFLSKKNWHPGTIRNNEKVWIAEQKDLEEQRKLKEKQKELQEEREVKRLRELNGTSKKKNQERVEWMYEVPAAKSSADDYLTGQTLATIESGEDTIKSLQEKKVPGATWLDKSNNQISDEFSRINEDPMFAIKKQEIETKKKTLNNPLQLKRVREKLLEKGYIDKAKLIDALLKKAAGSINSKRHSNKDEEDDKKDKKHHHRHNSHSKHHKSHKNRKDSSSSVSDSESDKIHKNKDKKKNHNHHHHKSRKDRSISSSDRDSDKDRKHHHSKRHKISKRSPSSSSSSSSRSSSESRSRSRSRNRKKSNINNNNNSFKRIEETTKKNFKRETGISKTLSKEEREAKIAEMLKDGKINEELRWNRLMKHEKKEKDEELEESKNPLFLRDINKQAFSVSEDNDGSIAERLQRRKNYVMDMREEP